MKMISLVLGLSVSALMAEFSVSTLGLQVTREGYGKGEFGKELSAFNSQGKPATEIAFLIESDGGKILKLQEKECKITSATDDKDGDLLAGKTFMGKAFEFVFPKTSEDGKAMLATLRLPVAPKKGSTKIEVKGEFVITTGDKTETIKTPDVGLKNDVKFKLGELSFTVEDVEESKFNKGWYEFTFKTNQSLDHVKEFVFLDGAGEKLETKKNGSSRMGGFGGKSTYTRSFRVEKKLEKITVSAEVFTDLKKETVSISETVSLGL